ncbi:MAG: hypothetical protein MI794_16300 [Pseudomonadales bacterium]|nr:hypothetical protein [Pseudomonadales bacterium]
MTEPTPLTFVDVRKPNLMAGRHEIRVSQTVEHLPAGTVATNTEKDEWQLAGTFAQRATLHVTAARWHLPDNQVDRVFPAPGSKGDYSQCFPYVLIDNPTLPWERSPFVQPHNGALVDTPWLALAVFDESAITDARQTPAASPCGPVCLKQVMPENWSEGPAIATPQFEEEPADAATKALTVVDIATELAAEKGLSATRLRRHACVVQTTDAAALGTVGEHALISCPELPGPGRHRLMLLSLEGWLNPIDGELVPAADAPSYRRFIVLGQWSFTSAVGEHARFTDIAKSVGVGLLRDQDRNTELHRQAGGQLFVHGQHTGVTTSSWRRGPLVPARLTTPPNLNPWNARSATALMLDPTDNAPSDASYAEAWEQGRLAALRKPVLSSALADCRRACAHQPTDTRHLFCGELGPQHPELPTDWLSALLRLEYTPYTSLVPAERLLPPEQLRFFLVDPHWLECFLAGAVSLGSPFASGDCERLDHHFTTMLQGIKERPVSGFVLRSRLVADWPKLDVQGRATHGGVRPVRVFRPASNILLALFADEIQSVTLTPPAHHLHLENRSNSAPGAAQWAAANAVVREQARFTLASGRKN